MTHGPDDTASGPGASGPDPSGLGPSGLGPMGDVALLAAVLGTDRADVASYARVLSGALSQALPPGTVQVGYRRGLGDRLGGRPGRAQSVLVHGPDRDLHLDAVGDGVVQAEIRRVSGGVVISRRRVEIDEWLHALAEDLSRIAARDASARRALERFLGTEP